MRLSTYVPDYTLRITDKDRRTFTPSESETNIPRGDWGDTQLRGTELGQNLSEAIYQCITLLSIHYGVSEIACAKKTTNWGC